MKSYWRLEEKERAALTVEEVEVLGRIELMEKGVVQMVAPEGMEAPTPVELRRETVFIVDKQDRYGSRTSLGIAFRDAESAHAFCKLKPFSIERDYQADVEYLLPHADLAVKEKRVARSDDVLAKKQQLDKFKEHKQANAERINEYNENAKKVKDALSGLWSDYYDCQAKDRRFKEMEKVLADYTETCEGDTETAMRFFKKVYSDEQIAEMEDWAGE